MYGLEFWENPWNLIFGTFWALLTQRDQYQKSGFVTFLTLWLSNFMQEIRKNWWANSEIWRCERTDERNEPNL